ncbi:unnamed protein product [Allacma fusca]|uniref:Reverse transcriptase/retrotransposon-derived protein RNase H-like domain-containing protein n=1 Tax=Allacma fusca TaxID=39272 RepID=A0A8J2PHQ2_9HEXA|nr:unnamed protein product [Allacma fusca]
MVWDRIVVGVSDRRLSEKHQLESALTIQKAITIARQFEAVKKQQDELQNPQVHRLNTRPKQNNRNSIQQQNSKTPDKHSNATQVNSPSSSKVCYWCGGMTIHKKETCPAKDADSPEVFQRDVHEILEGLPQVPNHTGDTLVWGRNTEDHNAKLRELLHRFFKAKLTLNKEKGKFGVKSVTFLGHRISGGEIKPEEKKVEAILKMSAPTDTTELLRFKGMVKYLAKFLPNLSEVMYPLNSIINSFTWGSNQQKCFKDVKKLIVSSAVLLRFDPNRPTIVSADASSYDLGCVLKQEDANGNWRPVASRK